MDCGGPGGASGYPNEAGGLTGPPVSILTSHFCDERFGLNGVPAVYLPNHNSQISLARSEIDFDAGAPAAETGSPDSPFDAEVAERG